MRAPTNYAGPRRKVPKPKQVSQSLESGLPKEAATVRGVLDAKADEGTGARRGGNDVVWVRKSDSVQHAVERLHEERIGAVVVLDSAGRLEGILSERDVVRALPGIDHDLCDVPVERLLTRGVTTCSPDTPLAHVLATMSEKRFRHMPVMEHGQLVGIVTIGDVVNHRIKELEREALSIKQVIVG